MTDGIVHIFRLSALQVLSLGDQADPAAADLGGHVAQHLQQRGRERLRPARRLRRPLAQPPRLALLQPVAPLAPLRAPAPLPVGTRGGGERPRGRPARPPLPPAALLELGRVHDALL